MFRRELMYGANFERGTSRYKQRINFSISSDFSFKECFRLSKEQVNYAIFNIGPFLQRKTKRSLALYICICLFSLTTLRTANLLALLRDRPIATDNEM